MQREVSPVTACPVTLRLQIVRSRTPGGDVHDLVVTAESGVPFAQSLALPDRCPEGPIAFEGLPAGTDVYDSCNKGACMARSPVRIELAAAAKVPIASARIAPSGASPCQRPLPPGRYVVQPVVPQGMVACVVPSLLEVPAPGAPPALPGTAPTLQLVLPKPAIPTPPLVPAPTTPPAPPPGAVATDIHSCEKASDCVLSCPKIQGCCSSSCGCRNAIHKAHRANYEASYAKTCMKPPKCPVEACMMDTSLRATCRAGRCVAVSGTSDHPY